MIAALKRAYAAFRGFDDETGSAPMMDGPLRPNALLDGAPIALSLTDVDNLTQHRGALLCSSGSQVLLLTPHNGSLSASDARAFEQAVTFVAAGPSDSLAIGLDRQGVLILEGRHAGKAIAEAGGQPPLLPDRSPLYRRRQAHRSQRSRRPDSRGLEARPHGTWGDGKSLAHRSVHAWRVREAAWREPRFSNRSRPRGRPPIARVGGLDASDPRFRD